MVLLRYCPKCGYHWNYDFRGDLHYVQLKDAVTEKLLLEKCERCKKEEVTP